MTTLRVSFFVPGTPIPKARPRVVRGKKSTFPITYTPKTTREWEKTIAAEFKRQCKGVFFGRDVALKIYVDIVAGGNGPRTCIRGDFDNHLKACADALNGVAFADDAQIVDARVTKRRGSKSEGTGAYIEIEPVSEVQSALFESELREKVS